MSLLKISHIYLQKTIKQLDRAMFNHKRWYRILIRSLVCRSCCDQNDLTPDSHKHCRFGKWYYSAAVDKNLQRYPRFVAIGKEHIRMHTIARKILKIHAKGQQLTVADYDAFSDSLDHFQSEMMALKHEADELIHYHDPLTKAINRLYMIPMLEKEKELLKRKNFSTSCLVMMDLDHFSNVNNTYGHTAGDKVLVSVVQYLLKHLRANDKIFRFGGEGFLILLQNIKLNKAYDLVERLRKGLARHAIDVGHGKKVHMSGSFGIAELTTRKSLLSTIEKADKAAYAAKAAGRNSVKKAVATK